MQRLNAHPQDCLSVSETLARNGFAFGRGVTAHPHWLYAHDCRELTHERGDRTGYEILQAQSTHLIQVGPIPL